MFRSVRFQAANNGPYAQLMVSACRAMGWRLSKGGSLRRYLPRPRQQHLYLRPRRHERQLLLGAYNSGAKPPPHSNKPKKPITDRSYNFPFGGHPVNQFSTAVSRSIQLPVEMIIISVVSCFTVLAGRRLLLDGDCYYITADS